MAKAEKGKKSGDRVEQKRKEDKNGEKKDKGKSKKEQTAATSAFSLLADEKAVNPSLLSLFAAKPTPPTPAPRPVLGIAEAAELDDGGFDESAEPGADQNGDSNAVEQSESEGFPPAADHGSKRKQKRKRDDEEIEDTYMRRLAREEAKEAEAAAAERVAKRQKALETAEDDEYDTEDTQESLGEAEDQEIDAANGEAADEDAISPPPRHETEQAADLERSKANRTVFLGNVSTAAISSKVSRKSLLEHLRSFFNTVTKPRDGEPKHAIESIRFRSTPYATAIPKKAAFARKEVMDATTKSTNAYAVYSSPVVAREAARQLNGTEVLGRHIRVDEVAHPSPVDHKRCVFVGNLGFVDDETNIQAANAEEGKEKRKPSKHPADVEEGLWRTFGKCGTVESVRVIRDSSTRVGKGIAYVQFEDANAVEAALLHDGKKFPPMLPRKLRVSRAKAQKRNARPGSGRPSSKPSANGYQRKISSEEASKMGRAGKLFGRAAAAQMKQKPREDRRSGQQLGSGIKKPESFVFEGYRASNKGGKSGLKLGGRGKKKGGKPTSRSAKRGAAYKAGKKVKQA